MNQTQTEDAIVNHLLARAKATLNVCGHLDHPDENCSACAAVILVLDIIQDIIEGLHLMSANTIVVMNTGDGVTKNDNVCGDLKKFN